MGGPIHVSAQQAAQWWRLIIQPLAESVGLKLVSPSTGIFPYKIAWMIEFLQACYNEKDSNPPCDVTKIEAFSLDEQNCYASFWRKYAAQDGGDDVSAVDPSCGGLRHPNLENFYTKLKTAMRGKYGEAQAKEFWDPYFSKAKLWVTETSCSEDMYWNKALRKLKFKPNAEE